MGGMSDSEKQNILKDTIDSMRLGTFGSRNQLENHIRRKLTEDEKSKKLEELLAEFGVLKLRKEAAISLSGGERRRVELARALAASPDFILLDEPFTGIDPIAIGEIKENIRKLSIDKGLGVLITDHNPKATLSITDRAYVIFDGQIKIQGRSEEVAKDPVAKEFYLGKDFTL